MELRRTDNICSESLPGANPSLSTIRGLNPREEKVHITCTREFSFLISFFEEALSTPPSLEKVTKSPSLNAQEAAQETKHISNHVLSLNGIHSIGAPIAIETPTSTQNIEYQEFTLTGQTKDPEDALLRIVSLISRNQLSIRDLRIVNEQHASTISLTLHSDDPQRLSRTMKAMEHKILGLENVSISPKK